MRLDDGYCSGQVVLHIYLCILHSLVVQFWVYFCVLSASGDGMGMILLLRFPYLVVVRSWERMLGLENVWVAFVDFSVDLLSIQLWVGCA